MTTFNIDLSIANPEKSVLDQVLEALNMDYVSLADYLGLDRRTLWQYRAGKREFKLNMEQIHKLEELLAKVGLSLKKLPSDWYLDKRHNN